MMPPTPKDLGEVTAIILGCVAGRHPGPAQAKDLYDSALFTRRRRYAEASGRPWLIFSAQHGILNPDDVIEWYDVSMVRLSTGIRGAKGLQAAQQLEERFGPTER